jgi:poly(3-hydroxybutyrate) depolymerase
MALWWTLAASSCGLKAAEEVATQDVGVETASDTKVEDVPGDAAGAACDGVESCMAGDGCCPAGCGYQDDLDCALCDPSVGLATPMLTCTAERPCTHPLFLYEVDQIDSPGDAPTCATSDGASGPLSLDDGPPMSWVDEDGVTRWACVHRPEGAPTRRPLLIYIHGSGGSATEVYDLTTLRAKAVDHDLGGTADGGGFVLVATQGRNLHWPTEHAQDGSKHDTFHRDLFSNRDVAFVDHLIDQLTDDEALVDPDRIYITGWSNGARFAAMYALGRHVEPTPGGHRVAAAAVYSGGDPYENIRVDHAPSCKMAPYPTVSLPFMLVSRTCDAVACDEAQLEGLVDDGFDLVPGNVAETWVTTLREEIGSPEVLWRRVGGNGQTYDGCTPASLCTTTHAGINHLRWPNGVADGGEDHEPAMLDFLREHPLNWSP